MRTAARIDGLGTTIFTEMTALAERTGAINLGQGFPDHDGPAEVIDAAVAALHAGANQYAPLSGVEPLREAVRAHQRHHYGLEPEDVLVTFGATEAIASALLALCEQGDEVILIEPHYDSYPACVAFAGATPRFVTLRPPDFALEPDALTRAVTSGAGRTRAIIVNTPHNPSGRVFTREELGHIAAVCAEHDLVCISDEVYEHLVYDGEHVPPATLAGMAERTLTISSIGKSFSVTGWKIGWCSGPAELVAATRAVKQFLTFAGGTPLQHAAAAALSLPPSHLDRLREQLRGNRDALCAALRRAGFDVVEPAGTYFVNADVGAEAGRFCAELPERCGVVAIPTSVFYADRSAAPQLVRFAFCKRPEVVAEAARRLASLG
jgi:N-succinyldiaminopimelate aminotransferase